MTAFVAIPRAAAQQLLDDLHARIDSAHLTDVSMFPGIAELRDALAVGDTPMRLDSGTGVLVLTKQLHPIPRRPRPDF